MVSYRSRRGQLKMHSMSITNSWRINDFNDPRPEILATTSITSSNTSTHVWYIMLLFSLPNPHQSLYDEDSGQSQNGIQDGNTAIKGKYTWVSVSISTLSTLTWRIHSQGKISIQLVQFVFFFLSILFSYFIFNVRHFESASRMLHK